MMLKTNCIQESEYLIVRAMIGLKDQLNTKKHQLYATFSTQIKFLIKLDLLTVSSLQIL
jgi:hypothetical protein